MGLRVLALVLVVWASSAYAEMPACLSGKTVLPVDNHQVLEWKTTTPNQFLARAHVTGTVTRVFPDRNGHAHFEIEIGSAATDVLEVTYSLDFGALPEVQIGAKVEACGDYITSTAPTAQYPASPSGALIHWIHKNPSGKGHDSGYLILDGVLYGWKVGRKDPADHSYAE